jgi:hypothetical protein
MTSPRHRRTPKAAPASAPLNPRAARYSPTIQLLPGEPDTTMHLNGNGLPPVADEPAPLNAGGLTAAHLHHLAVAIATEDTTRVPVPDRDSRNPADRTEWFRVRGGTEPLFEAALADLEAMWLLDTSLPVPPRKTAAGTPVPVSAAVTGTSGPTPRPEAAETPDPVSGVTPSGERAAETVTAPDPSLEAPDTVSTDDEPDAEPDCAEDGAA